MYHLSFIMVTFDDDDADTENEKTLAASTKEILIRKSQVRQCLGFCSADSYATRTKNQLYRNPNIV